jgi:hypothetical protein
MQSQLPLSPTQLLLQLLPMRLQRSPLLQRWQQQPLQHRLPAAPAVRPQSSSRRPQIHLQQQQQTAWAIQLAAAMTTLQ